MAQNDAQMIRAQVKTLLTRLLAENAMDTPRMVSVFFTVTPDLTAYNPARAAREVCPDWSDVPLLCAQEPVIEGMLPRCIRVLIQWERDTNTGPVSHVYLEGAAQLRPDRLG